MPSQRPPAKPEYLFSGVRPSSGTRPRCMRKSGRGDLHKSAEPSNRSLPWKSGAEAARTPDASRPPGDFEPREASGVRPIYRRFSSGAGRPAVHGLSACAKQMGSVREPPRRRGSRARFWPVSSKFSLDKIVVRLLPERVPINLSDRFHSPMLSAFAMFGGRY